MLNKILFQKEIQIENRRQKKKEEEQEEQQEEDEEEDGHQRTKTETKR